MTADLHHLAAAYALDALDDDERRAFELHYPACDICSTEVQEFREVASSLAGSAQTAPPAELRRRVLAEVTQTRQVSPVVTMMTTAHLPSGPPAQSMFRRAMAFSVAAALLLIGGLAAIVIWPSGATGVDQVVGSRDAVVTLLDSVADVQQGQLHVVWSDDRDQVAVVGSRLEDPGPDKAYALWFQLEDGGVAPAGLFKPEHGSVSAVLNIPGTDHHGWAITIEPAEGSSQPTSEVIFAGGV